MEVGCPNCDQRLRVPDDLRTARVRCRTCGNEFEVSSDRFANSAFAPPQQVAANDRPIDAEQAEPDEELRVFQNQPTTSQELATTKADIGKKAGWGATAFIVLLLISKAPKLLKLFQNRKQVPAVPAKRIAPEERRPIQRPPGEL